MQQWCSEKSCSFKILGLENFKTSFLIEDLSHITKICLKSENENGDYEHKVVGFFGSVFVSLINSFMHNVAKWPNIL